MQDLVKRKGGFSASPVYTNMGTACITTIEFLMTERIQLEQGDKKRNKKPQKNIDTRIKKLKYSMWPNTKRLKGEELKVMDLNNVIMCHTP